MSLPKQVAMGAPPSSFVWKCGAHDGMVAFVWLGTARHGSHSPSPACQRVAPGSMKEGLFHPPPPQIGGSSLIEKLIM